MATTIKYIGRTTDFKGKSLWEIVSNLKNFGVGRVVVRRKFNQLSFNVHLILIEFIIFCRNV